MLSGSISQILKSQRSLKKDLPWHLPGRTAKLSKLGFWHVCVVLQESLTDLAFPQTQPTVREKNVKQNWGLCDLWHQVKKTYGFPLCAVTWGCLSQGSFAKRVALVWTWRNYAPPHDLRQMRQKEVSSPGEAGITELLFWLLLFGAKLANDQHLSLFRSDFLSEAAFKVSRPFKKLLTGPWIVSIWGVVKLCCSPQSSSAI